MTFPEQILGVPPALVEQGWRREPTDAVLDAWTGDQRQHYRWESITVRDTENKRIQILRPITQISGPFPAWDGGCSIYAHAGWGDGLAPTPEMCKVWEYWWLRDPRGELKVCRVQVYSEQDMETADYWIGDRLAFYSDIPQWGTWAGPVLPPVRQS